MDTERFLGASAAVMRRARAGSRGCRNWWVKGRTITGLRLRVILSHEG
jgi:hypothetical protein